MILIEAGSRNDRAFDAKILFAAQLSLQGYSVAIDAHTVPAHMDRVRKYEIAPFLRDIDTIDPDHVILIGSETIDDDVLVSLRSYSLDPSVRISAIGRFEINQTRISAQSKLAYALGREPEIIDLSDMQRDPLLDNVPAPLATSGTSDVRAMTVTPRVFVYLSIDLLDDPLTLPMLSAMNNLTGFDLNVIVPGKGKEKITQSKSRELTVFGYSELSPSVFAKLADIAVFFGDSVPGQRMATFAMDMMQSGKLVIDGTVSQAFGSCGAPVLRGPEDIAALPDYLEHSVLINRVEIGRQMQKNPWLLHNGFSRLDKALKLARPGRTKPKRSAARVVFFPTNGNGLGHAQRCSLVATELKKPETAAFMAFPSCVGLIQSKGFDVMPLVQKSELHNEEFANDIVNHMRMNRALNDGDHLVFDGGYVFDSIFRTVLEKNLRATWIRRGLWQAGQQNSVALDRERIFDQVIVPEEAFDELNTDYSFGAHVHRVGPIVQSAPLSPAKRKGLRNRLADNFDRPFETLMVTMLGGGVAADRSAQMQALSAIAENRPDTLHLIVVWPNARVASGLYGWKNTEVVTTGNALALAQAADLTVSAVGYNSFHEILYHQIPAIFIPQMAAFMDDQETRARAASDRGLAETVLAHELLKLEREVRAYLDGTKAQDIHAALKAAELAKTGNAAAARLIEKRKLT